MVMMQERRVARPERLELPTLWFEARCSIQLSYGRAANRLTYTPSSSKRSQRESNLAKSKCNSATASRNGWEI